MTSHSDQVAESEYPTPTPSMVCTHFREGHGEGKLGWHPGGKRNETQEGTWAYSPPHPSFWSGFSCSPESRQMRQSSYLSGVPEAPAAR